MIEKDKSYKHWNSYINNKVDFGMNSIIWNMARH